MVDAVRTVVTPTPAAMAVSEPPSALCDAGSANVRGVVGSCLTLSSYSAYLLAPGRLENASVVTFASSVIAPMYFDLLEKSSVTVPDELVGALTITMPSAPAASSSIAA